MNGWLNWWRARTVDVNLTFSNALIIETREPSSLAGAWMTASCDGFTVKSKGLVMYTLPDDKMVDVQVSYVDKKGNPAKVDGNVVWTTSDDMIANVGVLQGDSTKAQIAPGKNLGQGSDHGDGRC
jgi:hypothetical protein